MTIPAVPLSDYAGEVLVAACGSDLHLWRPLQHLHLNANDDITHIKVPVTDHSNRNEIVQTAAWNRNNKVMAVATSDGGLQLRYGNGALMTLLKSGSGPVHGATDLSWSLGSKRLAVASRYGLHVHDMSSSMSVRSRVDSDSNSNSAPLSSPSPSSLGHFTAVAFHQEDRFLLAGGPNSLGLYSFQQDLTLLSELDCQRVGDSTWTTRFSTQSVDIAAYGGPLIAAGSQDGRVAVWDCVRNYGSNNGQPVQVFSPHRPQLHTCTSVRFLPLSPAILLSVHTSGELLVHDLRSFARKPERVSVFKDGSLTSLAVREDMSCIATGTGQSGRIHLLDLRQSQSAPWKTIECSSQFPVTCLSWQHRYQNMGSKAKEVEASQSEAGMMVDHVRACMGLGRHSIPEGPPGEGSVDGNYGQMGVAVPMAPSQSWSIKANSNVALNGADAEDKVEIRAEQPPCLHSPPKQPKKATLTPSPAPAPAPAPAPVLIRNNDNTADHDYNNNANPGISVSTETLQKDILALHLDMLTQFKEHQEAISSLVSDLLMKQKDLESQVEALRGELRNLLSRRDDILWL